MAKTFTADDVKARSQKLIQLYESMKTKHNFQPKQIVRWKKGMKNKGIPEYDEPAIVWEVLSQPRFDNASAHGAGSAYFQEPLDIVLGLFDEDDDFILFHFDSRRFEPVQ